MFEIVVVLLVAVAFVCLPPWKCLLAIWGFAALMTLVFGVSRSLTPRRFRCVMALWSAPVLMGMVVTLVIAPIAYHSGHTKGTSEVQKCIADGSIHQFAHRAAGFGYSMGNEPFERVGPNYSHYRGYMAALKEGIPEHSGDLKHAREVLGKLGAVFVVDEHDRVVAISLESQDFTDANVHWVLALRHLQQVKIKSPSVTNASVKYLNHFSGLSVLILEDTSITDDVIVSLRENLPSTIVRTSGSLGGSHWYKRGWKRVSRNATPAPQ